MNNRSSDQPSKATIRDFRIVQTEGARQVNLQYDQFAERRRLQAQQEAERRYIDDLKSTAEMLKRQRKRDEGK